MPDRKIIYLLLIVGVLQLGITKGFEKSSVLSKSTSGTTRIVERYKQAVLTHANLKCKYKCIAANKLVPKSPGRIQPRFIDVRSNDTMTDNEMEAPAAKFSIFNLLSDDEEEQENQDVVDDKDESVKDEDVEDEEEEDADDDGFYFFGPDEEISSAKPGGTKEESLLKQYHRHTLRMQHWVFPLLLAYKLKFFMVIPLLLGSLVLLIGTTAIAGFFFALFAAALGIHVKTHEH